MTGAAPLQLRRPAWVWTPLALLTAPALGALPISALLTTVLVVSSSDGLTGWVRLADTYARIVGIGLAAALVVGAPWALLSRRRPRRSRGRIVIETLVIGFAFAVAVSLLWGASALLGRDRVTDAATTVAPWKEAVYFTLMIMFYGAFLAAVIAPFAGAVVAWTAFTRTAPEATAS